MKNAHGNTAFLGAGAVRSPRAPARQPWYPPLSTAQAHSPATSCTACSGCLQALRSHCGAQSCARYTDVLSLCFLSIWHLVLLQICTGWSSMSGAACEALRDASRFDGSLHPLDVLPGGFSSASLCSCAHTNGNSWHLQTKRNPKQNGCPRWLLLFTIAALCCSITSVNAASELCFWLRFLSMAFSSIPVCFEGCGVFHGLKDSFPFVLCYHHYPLPPHFALALQKLAHCRCSSQNLQATITPTQRSVLEDISFTVCFLWVWCFSFI